MAAEIPVNLVHANQIDASAFMAYDEDGTLHVLITPQIEGTAESVSKADEDVTNKRPDRRRLVCHKSRQRVFRAGHDRVRLG